MTHNNIMSYNDVNMYGETSQQSFCSFSQDMTEK